ncbi:MAG: tRNA (adenosine(37)-N6)-dimethylallyltransferase MiaA [Alistipes sp.]|nr:tRNA (adenosine(37)-N6)-dimethylallyltransferase MiaA [Alistipes sp.]
MTATTTSIRRPTLIVIVGPTGSGKTSLSIDIARHYSAPIISTDSRQVYRGMAIGTAQPSAEELAAAEHHFIADREIFDDFNCGRYEQEALARLEELFSKHDVVVAVGGSGLYIQALCDGLDALPEADDELRQELKHRLENEGIESLVAQLRELDEKYVEEVDVYNPQRIVRALEVCLVSGRPYSELRRGSVAQRNFDIIKVGTEMDREVLYDRINRRVDIMLRDGLLSEVEALLPHRHLNSLQTVGYREFFDYFDGKCSLEESIELVKRNSRRYAKRQMTWFRRDESIAWFSPERVEEIIEYIDSKILQN